GDWKKYSNNFGYVSTDDYHQTLQAFSHFTYQYSSTDFFYIKLIRLGGQLIVVDLQGLLDSKSNTFYLTDPAIHTVKNYLEKYGNSNLGTDGINAFFRTHVCNNVCKKLKLK